MLTVQDDWIQYEAVPARRVAVRGGAACAQRIPVVRAAAPVRAVPAGIAAEPVRPRVSRRARRPRLRLTRRGRAVLVVMPGLLALSGALVVLSGTGTAEAAPVAPTPAATTSAGLAARVVVRAGDSLWAIAERIAPGDDPRAVVVALQRANGLHGSVIRPGDVLRLPAAG